MFRVGVHVVCKNAENKVLLVHRNYLLKDWALPGGMMEEGESIATCGARECLEESGYQVQTGSVIAIASRVSTNDVIIVLEATIIGSAKATATKDEIAGHGFFAINELPTPMNKELRELLHLYDSGQRGKVFNL